MSPQIRMLIWREWRERRVAFLACLLWVLLGTAYAVACVKNRGFSTPVSYFWSMGGTFALIAPNFLAMRTAMGELTDRSRPFSDGLPISLQTRGWIRWGGGMLVLMVPLFFGGLLLSMAVGLGWIQQIPLRVDGARPALERPLLSIGSAMGLVWTVTVISIACAGTLHALLSIVNMRLKSEMQAGFVGAALTVSWLFASEGPSGLLEEAPAWAVGLFSAALPHSIIINYGYETGQGSYGDLAMVGVGVWHLVASIVFQLGLGWWFVRCYEGQLTRVSRRRAAVSESGRHRIPWLPNRGAALAWYSFRTSIVMCIPGLVIAGLMNLMTMRGHPLPSDDWVTGYADALAGTMWMVGCIWAVVVGAGLFAAEVDSRMGEFWRTRPISLAHLFGMKFFVGLAAVLLVLDGSAVVISVATPNWGHYYSMNWPYIACIIPQHALFFSIAVAVTCWLRRPALGGLLAVVLFFSLQLTFETWLRDWRLDPLTVYNSLHGSTDFVEHGYPAMAALLGTLLALNVGLGFWGLRRYAPTFDGD